ncbi:hypothetical protein NLJ89_g8505 [Agrocybe chaxingu]|uniref:Alpha/beta-hydrolase n=1 Tax=Agrocybe chaxingu TaxID=84603 RepID=A0A9W8JXC9_9AGAR|nr:hypothetical protein NLJ89_g8505 [Agrocybe chaxingu]
MTSISNINDPAGVAALLDQLKSSAAWQELTNASQPTTVQPDTPPFANVAPIPAEGAVSSENDTTVNDDSTLSSTSVASLLSQLKTISTGPDLQAASGLNVCSQNITGPSQSNGPRKNPTSHYISSSVALHGQATTDAVEDLTKLSFAQSLPSISCLAEDPAFVSALTKLRKDQDDLERQLWTEREALYTKYHEKFKVAQTKAQMIGTTVSQHEQDMMNDAFKKEIFKFDHNRVIPAWDGLVSRQQLELVQLKVPTMFVTGEARNREPRHILPSVPIMPCVDLHSKADYASIYYTTNSPHSNVGGFDPEKPTIVILHPIFLDSTWLDLQLGDSRLNKHYNIIAFDMRCSGKSQCRPSGRHDSWVDCADLAFCFQKLHLPPSHILALEGSSINCALRLALLFPEMCLSLTLVNVPAPVELKWIYKNLDELVHGACFAEDLYSFEQSAYDCLEFLFGPASDRDLIDELIAFWELSLPPRKRARLAETTSVYINRSPLSPDAQVVGFYAPGAVIMTYGVKDGAILYTVRGKTVGGTSMLSVVPGHASIVNRAFANFLARLPHHRSDIVPPELPIKERMRVALKKLSEITGNPKIASLDPSCSISFSLLSPEVVKSQTELVRHYQKDADIAFSPMTLDGKPLRKYSERERVEWSHIETGSAAIVPPERGKESERVSKSSSRSDSQHNPGDSPLLKTAFSPTSSEIHILKEIKVANITPLQRLMT